LKCEFLEVKALALLVHLACFLGKSASNLFCVESIDTYWLQHLVGKSFKLKMCHFLTEVTVGIPSDRRGIKISPHPPSVLAVIVSFCKLLCFEKGVQRQSCTLVQR